MSAFTPGPWKAIERHPDIAVWGRDEDGDPVGEHVASIYGDGTVENAEANARLIAAAPDVYEALKAMYAAMPNCDGDHIMDDKGNFIARAVGIGAAAKAARAAIAKAEGTS